MLIQFPNSSEGWNCKHTFWYGVSRMAMLDKKINICSCLFVFVFLLMCQSLGVIFFFFFICFSCSKTKTADNDGICSFFQTSGSFTEIGSCIMLQFYVGVIKNSVIGEIKTECKSFQVEIIAYECQRLIGICLALNK